VTSAGPPAWTDALRSDFELEQLIRALSLADRFHLYVLVCVSPRVADIALGVIEERVAEEREQPVEIMRLDPYRNHRDITATIPHDLLVKEVLEPLVTSREWPERAIVVVDASRAMGRDNDAWGLLFQRMNERRNVIVAKLGRPLVLCIPPRLEPIFARAAPDFWSIRSLAVEVKAAPPPLEMRGEELTNDARKFREHREVGTAEDEEALTRAVEAARRSLAESPRDVVRMLALAVRLERLASYAFTRRSLEVARSAAEEHLALRRRLVEQKPDRPEPVWKLSFAASLAGDVYLVRGDLDWSTTMHKEAVHLARTLVALEPRQAKWLKRLTRALLCSSDIYAERGDVIAADDAQNESASLIESLINSDSDDYESVERARGLATLLAARGDLHRFRDDLDNAATYCDRSYALFQTLGDRSGQAEALRLRGRVRWRLNDIDRAASDYDHALTLARAVEDQRLQARILTLRGDLRRFRDDVEGAEDDYEHALSLLQKAGARMDQAPVFLSRGELRRWRGDLDGADNDYNHALALFRNGEDRSGQGNTLLERGSLQFLRNRLDDAIRDFDDALTLFELDKNSLGQANVFLAYSRLEHRRSNLLAARQWCEKAVALYRAIRETYGLANGLAQLARVHASEGNAQAAEQFASEALDAARRGENRPAARTASSVLQRLKATKEQ
jgi:tetratricopeptide (TPR) repeat protein